MTLNFDVELFFGDTNPDAAIMRLRPPSLTWTQGQAEALAQGFPQWWREQTGVQVRVVSEWPTPPPWDRRYDDADDWR